MKRIAYTTAPHPITGHDAHLEIFEAGQDSVMRCTLTARDGIDTIVYAGKQPEAVIRETGLFWHLDQELTRQPTPGAIEIPAIAWAHAAPDSNAIVTVYDDRSGRALLQRVSDGPNPLTVTWKSPEYDPAGWMEANAELDWQRIDPSAPAAPKPDANGYWIDTEHVHFEAKRLSIGWAITYQDAPRTKGTTDNGGTKSSQTSLRFPLLVAGEYVEDAEEVCKAAAAILERNKAEMGAK